MLKIKMIDVELDFPYDLADPNDAEKWEDALDKYMKDLVQIEGKKNTRQSQIIRDEIAYEKAWLDVRSRNWRQSIPGTREFQNIQHGNLYAPGREPDLSGGYPDRSH